MRKTVIMHVDVNSAYLSWEAAYRLQKGSSLDLRTVPSVVGGDESTRHGIVLAKSIPAKRYGIKTGETLYSARAKCPGLIVVPPNYPLYMQCSTVLGDLLREYSPLVEQYSVDEYFIDMTGTQSLGDPVQLAYQIKDRIRNELGFTVNIGISSNKLLAKMGSELEKPDKVHTLFPEEIKEKMWPLKVDELFMVGKATAKKLLSRNIRTIGELANANPEWLQSFLKKQGIVIWNYANGRDLTPVRVNRRPVIKGIGNSTTTAFDVEERRDAHLVILSLVETVAARLRSINCCCRLVSVSFRTHEFYHASHQKKFHTPTDSTKRIYEIACELFDELWQGTPVRHLGVRVSELCSNDFFQPAFFNEKWEKERALDQAIDAIRKKHGTQAVYRASFLQSGLKPMTGGTGEEIDYPIMSSFL